MSASPKIVVVGVCASGKTTLVEGLRARGYRARSVALEHSNVPRLWTYHDPDFLVVLDCSLDTIRKRRLIPGERSGSVHSAGAYPMPASTVTFTFVPTIYRWRKW